MYAPEVYRETDLGRMARLIRETGFGLLISTDGRGIMTTYAPMLLEADGDGPLRIIGHIARANEQWRRTAEGSEVVALFTGPHGYITPRWYRDEPDVPTWNYRAVEARGRFTLITDASEVRSLLSRSVDHFEHLADGAWALGDIDEKVVEGFQRGVAAFAINDISLSAATKHSQDKTPTDRERVIEGLIGAGRADLASDMIGEEANGL